MAETVTITLGSVTLDVIVEGSDIGTPEHDFGLVTNPLSRRPVQTLGYVSGQRQWRGIAKIEGVASLEESAADNKVRQAHNLAVEVAKPENVLTVVGADRTTTTVFRVRRNDAFTFPWGDLYEYGDEAHIPLVLNVDPWTEGESVSQILATEIETPNVVDFTVAGSRPAELKLTATRGFTGSGLQTFMAALIPPDVDLADILLLAKTATGPNWDRYTATSGYETGDDNTRICTDTTYRALYWPGKVQPVGRYSLVAKCRIQTGGKGWLAQSRESNLQATPAVALTDNDWRFVRLGDWASDGYTAPRIVGKCREAENGILVDWVLAVPLALGSPLYFHCTAAEVAKVVSEWLETSMQLASGAWRSARRYTSGPGLEGVGDCRLLVAAIDANGALRRPDVTLELEHTPLFDHWVPTPEA